MSFNEWMAKQAVIHPCTGMPPSNGKEQTIDTQPLGWISEVLCGVKEACLNGYIVHNTIYMIFSKKTIWSDWRYISICQELEVEEVGRGSQWSLLGDETVLHSVITIIYKCGNIHRSAYSPDDSVFMYVSLTFKWLILYPFSHLTHVVQSLSHIRLFATS